MTNNIFPKKYDLIEIVSCSTEEHQHTYDIEVETVHAFTAQNPKCGLESVSHNSATICLFSPDDKEMCNAKVGDWFLTNPQRGRSNNSALLVKDKTTRQEFNALFKSTKEFGEPGFIWAEHENVTFNPCSEIGMWPIWTDNKGKEHSGWQFCNLTEMNGKRATDRETFLEMCKAAAIIGTLQAGYDSFPYVGAITENITRREALLGCSITGMMDNPETLFNPEIQREGAKVVKEWNKKIAALLGINEAARCTTVKPAGCLTKESLIKTEKGNVSLEEIFNMNGYDTSYIENLPSGTWLMPKIKLDIINENGEKEKISKLYVNGPAITYEVEFVDGSIYSFTGEHKLKTTNGEWKRVEDLTEDDEIAMCNRKSKNMKIKSTKKICNLKPTYDIETEHSHTYTLANGCISHNSSSCVLGTGSGIHPHHSRQYFRRVQANKMEFPAQHFKQINPVAVEESVWSANNTDEVITFLCEVPPGAKLKNDMSALDLLEHVKLTQMNWIEYGTNKKLCVKPFVRHNVSNTITVKPEEWDDVEKFIYNNRKHFAGISLLPFSGDKDYDQAPFCAVYTPAELVKMYGDATVFASGLIVDCEHAFDTLFKGCDTLMGIGETLTTDRLREHIRNCKDSGMNGFHIRMHGYPNDYEVKLTADSSEEDLNTYLHQNVHNWDEKLDWVRRGNQFAERYFNGDLRQMTYCLKDVSNWKKWCDLSRSYKDVNWDDVVEEQHYIKVDEIGAQACSGGACEII